MAQPLPSFSAAFPFVDPKWLPSQQSNTSQQLSKREQYRIKTSQNILKKRIEKYTPYASNVTQINLDTQIFFNLQEPHHHAKTDYQAIVRVLKSLGHESHSRANSTIMNMSYGTYITVFKKYHPNLPIPEIKQLQSHPTMFVELFKKQ